MPNKVLAFLEKAGKEVEIVTVDIVDGCEIATKVLTDSKALSPEVITGIKLLISDAESIATASVGVAGSEGVNFVADAAGIAAVEKLVKDFIALLPTLKTAAKTIAADV